MSSTPFTDEIETRIILTEDGAILDGDDARRLLALARRLESLSAGGPVNLSPVLEAFRNGRGDTHLQGRLLDRVLFPSHQEILR